MLDYLYLCVLLLVVTLYYIGEKNNMNFLTFLSGCLLIIFSIYIMINGTPNYGVGTFDGSGGWVLLSSFIMIGVGLLFIYRASYEKLEEVFE